MVNIKQTKQKDEAIIYISHAPIDGFLSLSPKIHLLIREKISIALVTLLRVRFHFR